MKLHEKTRVLIIGMGTMGTSHARAYKTISGFEIAGLCSTSIEQRADIASKFYGVPLFSDFAEALETLGPDAVSINTWPDTHAAFANGA